MQLRYRENSSKGYTILKEFSPPFSTEKPNSKNKGDLLPPSLLINKETLDEAKKDIIVFGMKNETTNSLKEILGTVLDDHKLQSITNIEISNDRARIKCRSPSMAKNIYDLTNGKQIGEVKINMSLFQ